MIWQWWAGHRSWGRSQISHSGGAQGWSLHSHARAMLRGTQHGAPSRLGPILYSCCYHGAGSELLLSLPMQPGFPLPSPALTWGLPPAFKPPASPCHGTSCLHAGVHRTAPPLVPLSGLVPPIPHAPVLSSHCSHILVGRSPADPVHGCLTPFLFFGMVQRRCCQ